MSRLLQRRFRGERGQALVEMALVLPLLLLLIFGIVEFGRIGHAYLTLNHAAREGARLGITGAADEEVIDRINYASGMLNSEELEIRVDPSLSDRISGDEFVVELSYELPIYMPLPVDIIPNPLPLQGRSLMRME